MANKDKLSLKQANIRLKDLQEQLNEIDLSSVNTRINEVDSKVITNDTSFKNHEKDFTRHIPYGVATFTAAGVGTVSVTPAPTTLVDGMGISFKVNIDVSNATKCTLNVNGKGAKDIKDSNGKDVTSLKKDSIYTVRYNGVSFTLQGESGGGSEYDKYIENVALLDDRVPGRIIRKRATEYNDYSSYCPIGCYTNSEFTIDIYDIVGYNASVTKTDTRANEPIKSINIYRNKYEAALIYTLYDGRVFTLGIGGTDSNVSVTIRLYSDNLELISENVHQDVMSGSLSQLKIDRIYVQFTPGTKPNSDEILTQIYNPYNATNQQMWLKINTKNGTIISKHTSPSTTYVISTVPEYIEHFGYYPVVSFKTNTETTIFDKDYSTKIRTFNNNNKHIDTRNPPILIEVPSYIPNNKAYNVTLYDVITGKVLRTISSREYYSLVGFDPLNMSGDPLSETLFLDTYTFRGIEYMSGRIRFSTFGVIKDANTLVINRIPLTSSFSQDINIFDYTLGRTDLSGKDIYFINSLDTRGMTAKDMKLLFISNLSRPNYNINTTLGSLKPFKSY